MIVVDAKGLTTALKRVVLDLEADLRDRVESQPEVRAAWGKEHDAAVKRERTAMSWQAWRDDRVTQAAVAWVLTTVFVRFCEDNQLLAPVWIAGPGERRQEALDAELAYYRANPEHTNREWVLQAVEHLGRTKATRDLVESHSALWTVSPSGQAAKRLLEFWRERTADGDLVWDLADPGLSTRFLGDLYQDLSDYAKKTYALLQTPEFVEEFILDQTLEPALKERPLEGFRLIDPTCGSGHFLLGAFARLNERWAAHAPGLEVQARVREVLRAIHGVDLNPFAVAIARFRLLVAALQACGLTSLEGAPAFEFHLAAGDSLLHGQEQLELDLPGIADHDATLSGFTYASEDLHTLRKILVPGSYDVVVGNPPYITVKDKKLNAAYRALYPTCKGTYALTVPFMERFFQLAKPVAGDRPAGWAGQITSNSFMKREFGSKLIEEFLSKQDLRLLVDTSGAYIPGHGTPTVILVGRSQSPSSTSVRAVLGIRGEPGQPENPAGGLVWRSIVENINSSDFDNDYVSIADLPRAKLASHPWSLSGGGAEELLVKLVRPSRVGDIALSIGRTTASGEDEVFFTMPWVAKRLGLADSLRAISVGEIVRDFGYQEPKWIWWPYKDRLGREAVAATSALVNRVLWPFRMRLEGRVIFGQNLRERNRPWYEHLECYSSKLGQGRGVGFAFVATHNHFAYDRKALLFNRTSPVIKLPEEATEDDHLGLLGVLNSSTACFWLKQNSHDKGNRGGERSTARFEWEHFFEFTGTTLQDFPLPKVLPVDRTRSLDDDAQRAAVLVEAMTARESPAPSPQTLDAARIEAETIRARMISEQEELDWHVYNLYGLIDEDLAHASTDLPGLALGERAFEIALSRRVRAGDESDEWFVRHSSRPITEIPAHLPAAYRDLVQRRLDLIESNRFINLLERPEYKRRWATEPWEKRVEKALCGWLLDRLEHKQFWFDAQGRPVARSLAQVADPVSHDPDLVSVLELWSGRKDLSVTEQLTALLADESVPFLAAHRLKESGLRKRQAWEHTWDLQRREDAGENVGTIPVPPKYASTDFRKQSWWQHRGKLDVPKERFILYPNAGRQTDSTPLLGWAGWDHAQQALALNAVIAEREGEGWADDRLVPLVAGLTELQPWVRQWHNEVDPTYQLNLADYLDEELRRRAHQVGLTLDQLRAWQPDPPSRGRTRKETL